MEDPDYLQYNSELEQQSNLKGITCIREEKEVDADPFTIEIQQKPGVQFNMSDALLTLVDDHAGNSKERAVSDTDKRYAFEIPEQISKVREQILIQPLELSIERGQAKQVQVLPNFPGYCYIGEWKQDKPHGLGKLYSQTMYLEGGFTKGIFSAKDGIKIWIDGSYYRGQFSNFSLDGYGTYFNRQENSTYRGFWMHNYPNGLGTEIVQGQFTYKGQFSKGKRHGKGQIVWQNGDSFEGHFKNGKMNDSGCLKTSNFVFKGMFRQGKKDSGCLETEDQFYEGKFVNQVFEDVQAVFKWKDTGVIYKGSFKEGKKHGKGTITFPNGDTLQTIWQKDHIVIKK